MVVEQTVTGKAVTCLHLTARQCGSLLSQLLQNLGLSNSRNQLGFIITQMASICERILKKKGYEKD
jgi:hypothetical protein